MKKYIAIYHINQNRPGDNEIIDVNLIEADSDTKARTIFLKWFSKKYPENYLDRLLLKIKEHSSVNTINS